MRLRLPLIIFATATLGIASPETKSWVDRDATPLYQDYFNRDFPFFEATLELPDAEVPHDVLPRAVVLPLEHNLFVAYDTELLRVAAVWQGDFPTKLGIAMKSYAIALNKMKGGTDDLSQLQGDVWYRSTQFTDWFSEGRQVQQDPRSAWTDPLEHGRGPLPLDGWQWSGIDVSRDGAVLRYQVAGVAVQERFTVVETDQGTVVRRHLSREANGSDLTFAPEGNRSASELQAAGAWSIDYSPRGISELREGLQEAFPISIPTGPLWPETATTSFEAGESAGGFTADELTLPYPNPWHRRIRLVDLVFSDSGIAHAVTYDGDVYEIEGLEHIDGPVTWRRVAAGFNEPMAIERQGADIFVFSRGGVTRLVDQNGDREFETYRLFSNRFVQSPDTRDFCFSLVALPDGGFLISKGGQQVSSLNPHSGRILRLGPEGTEVTIHATGFRNAFIARDPQSGIITGSDQQGNWIPSTPFHIIEPEHFYGHGRSSPVSPAPVTAPRLWFPHAVSPSAVGVVSGFDSRMPGFEKSALMLDYKTSRGLVIDIADPQAPQTSSIVLPLTFETPVLNGAINPMNGLPYLVGFQVWDSNAPRLEGLSRLRPSSKPVMTIPTASPFEGGILLRGVESGQDSSFEVKAWNYQRSEKYGSPQFRQDGEPGIDRYPVLATTLSTNRQDVFLHLPDWQPSMSVVVTQHAPTRRQDIYLTANQLSRFDEATHGFGPINWEEIAELESAGGEFAVQPQEVSIARGLELSTQLGCIGCHATSAGESGKSGPSWVGLAGSIRHLTTGVELKADRDYLIEAILDPTSKVTKGYDDPDAGMPPYLGVLADADLASVLLYIESLR